MYSPCVFDVVNFGHSEARFIVHKQFPPHSFAASPNTPIHIHRLFAILFERILTIFESSCQPLWYLFSLLPPGSHPILILMSGDNFFFRNALIVCEPSHHWNTLWRMLNHNCNLKWVYWAKQERVNEIRDMIIKIEIYFVGVIFIFLFCYYDGSRSFSSYCTLYCDSN